MFIANSASGTVSVIDPDAGVVLDEFHVGGRLTDLAATSDGKHLLLTDAAGDRLVLVDERDGRRDGHFKIAVALQIRGEPVSVCLAHSDRFCSVASLWAHRVTLVSLRDERSGPNLSLHGQIDLPFAPRTQCLSADDARLFVADAFGGQIAVIDTKAAAVVSICQFDGHNIRGLALDEAQNELIVAHQLLDEQIATTASHISWGGVISNVLRSIPLTELVPARDSQSSGPIVPRTLAHWSLDPLGKTGDGLGDPSALTLTSDGQIAVALGGVDKIAWRALGARSFIQRPVGAQPVALATDRQNRRLFVANRLDDSISVIDLAEASVRETISLGPRPEPNAVERGERLFYDARLSLHGWYSCHSCHTDGHTSGLLNDNLGDGTFGYPKRIPSLLGTVNTAPWAWNGSQPDLTEQIRSSLVNTMHGPPEGASDRNVSELAAYLETLAPPPGLGRARGDVPPTRGAQLFNDLHCTTCHAGTRFTSAATYDVGVHDPHGATHFNPPSLLGVSQRGPFFHDGRSGTLRDVFERHHHGDTHGLVPRDLDSLVVYLNSL